MSLFQSTTVRRHLQWIGSLALVALLLGAFALHRRPLRYAVHTLDADERTLALAQEAGFDTAVQLFSWRQIEPTRGQYHWQYPDEVVQGAEYYGLDLVVRLDQHPEWASSVPLSLNAPPDDLTDYARFVHTVASRYRGRILAYIIWNEPNLAVDWGGRPPAPARYVEMLRVAYAAVKDADPAALVVSAGLAPTNSRDTEALDDRLYLEAMYQAGAQAYFDVLGVHAYGFGHPPEDDPGAHEGMNLARVQELRRIMVRYGDAGKSIWATEMGWTVEADGPAAWQMVTPQQQADYLVGAFRRARREWPWLQLMAVWNLGGEGHPKWGSYSLLDAGGQPRPAYHTLRRMAKSAAFPFWRRARSGGPTRGAASVTVLAEDAVFHLGDSDFTEPWMPLYGVRNPSTHWRGTFYMREPGTEPWNLTLRIMQSNVWGNYVWVNGHRLEPPFPTEDFSGSWVSYTWQVPAEILQPGPNHIQVTVNRILPVLQAARFAWDDLQIKDVVLWR